MVPRTDGEADRARRGFWFAHLAFAALLALSARHFVRAGDFLWTEEGSRFAWNMRLLSKNCTYRVSQDQRHWRSLSFESLTSRQRMVMSNPQHFLAYVQRTVCPDQASVYADVRCTTVGREPAPLLDPGIDLCRAHYSVWAHNDWISLEPGARARPLESGARESGNESEEGD